MELPDNFRDSERGNTLLSDDDGGLNAWIRLDGNVRLEISYRPANYPALNVATVKLSDAELLTHIKNRCQGMYVRKLNLDGADFDHVVPYGDD